MQKDLSHLLLSLSLLFRFPDSPHYISSQPSSIFRYHLTFKLTQRPLLTLAPFIVLLESMRLHNNYIHKINTNIQLLRHSNYSSQEIRIVCLALFYSYSSWGIKIRCEKRENLKYNCIQNKGHLNSLFMICSNNPSYSCDLEADFFYVVEVGTNFNI